MLGPEHPSDRRVLAYEVKVAENRLRVGGVGLGATILFSALTALGLPRPVWAVAAGIGTALFVYALLVENPAEGGAGGASPTQYNDGGSGSGDRIFVNQINLGVPPPSQGAPESGARKNQEDRRQGEGE